jgi:hypothetical protein
MDSRVKKQGKSVILHYLLATASINLEGLKLLLFI